MILSYFFLFIIHKNTNQIIQKSIIKTNPHLCGIFDNNLLWILHLALLPKKPKSRLRGSHQFLPGGGLSRPLQSSSFIEPNDYPSMSAISQYQMLNKQIADMNHSIGSMSIGQPSIAGDYGEHMARCIRIILFYIKLYWGAQLSLMQRLFGCRNSKF